MKWWDKFKAWQERKNQALFLKEVLAEINSARRVMMLPELPQLPAGVPKSSHSCPVAITLRAQATKTGIYFRGSPANAKKVSEVWGTSLTRATRVGTTPAIRKFIELYDTRRITL